MSCQKIFPTHRSKRAHHSGARWLTMYSSSEQSRCVPMFVSFASDCRIHVFVVISPSPFVSRSLHCMQRALLHMFVCVCPYRSPSSLSYTGLCVCPYLSICLSLPLLTSCCSPFVSELLLAVLVFVRLSRASFCSLCWCLFASRERASARCAGMLVQV